MRYHAAHAGINQRGARPIAGKHAVLTTRMIYLGMGHAANHRQLVSHFRGAGHMAAEMHTGQ